MITAVAGAAVPVPVDVVAGKQPANGILEVGLRAAPSLDQCDAGSCVRDKDLTQSVAAIATELKDPVSEISDKTASGTHLHNIAIHRSIIPTAGVKANATFDSEGITSAPPARHAPDRGFRSIDKAG